MNAEAEAAVDEPPMVHGCGQFPAAADMAVNAEYIKKRVIPATAFLDKVKYAHADRGFHK